MLKQSHYQTCHQYMNKGTTLKETGVLTSPRLYTTSMSCDMAWHQKACNSSRHDNMGHDVNACLLHSPTKMVETQVLVRKMVEAYRGWMHLVSLPSKESSKRKLSRASSTTQKHEQHAHHQREGLARSCKEACRMQQAKFKHKAYEKTKLRTQGQRNGHQTILPPSQNLN